MMTKKAELYSQETNNLKKIINFSDLHDFFFKNAYTHGKNVQMWRNNYKKNCKNSVKYYAYVIKKTTCTKTFIYLSFLKNNITLLLPFKKILNIVSELYFDPIYISHIE